MAAALSVPSSWAVSTKKNNYRSALYRRLASRRGVKRATEGFLFVSDINGSNKMEITTGQTLGDRTLGARHVRFMFSSITHAGRVSEAGQLLIASTLFAPFRVDTRRK